jgi:anti-anti-sigma factor
VGGEAVSAVVYEKMAQGQTKFLINMAGTKIVNSIGVSILIEIIEKLQEVNGKIGYYNLAPIVSKTFTIMGLTKYSSVFDSEEVAVSEL